MADTIEVRIGPQGELVLPEILREKYNLRPGATLTLLDLGGVFMLSPRRLEVDTLADRLQAMLEEEGESVASMLQAVREERERYTCQP